MTKAERDARIFQSYLENIHAKTGKTVEDFRALAEERGLSQHAELMGWLKSEFGLGHGHASAIVHTLRQPDRRSQGLEDQAEALFSGRKAHWRGLYDTLMAQVQSFGPDVEVSISKSAVSLFRGKRFAVLQPSTAERFDIGLNLGDAPPSGRLEAAGKWSEQVTHRVRLTDAAQLDAELLGWLRQAYDERR